MLTGADTPAGITGARDDYALILGAFAGDLRIDRIGTDDDGILSVDLTHLKPRLLRETYARLKLDSRFELRDDDTITEYRITELVPPNPDRHIVGWIKLRPIEGGIRERYPDQP
jgi:hypothetical protein